MVRQLVFDVRFKNGSGVGQQVDTDIRVLFFEEGETTAAATRYYGTNPDQSIVKTTDASGVVYTTTLDVTNFSRGQVTAKWYANQGGSPVEPSPYEESLANVFADGALNVGDIKTYIRSMLGCPQVAVELSGGQYTAIVEETLTLYSQHCPAERALTLAYSPSKQLYNLPQIPFNGPFDVKFVRKVISQIAGDPLFGREYQRAMQQDVGTLILGTAYVETINRIAGLEPEWRWFHEKKELYINTGPISGIQTFGGYDVTVRYYVPVTLEMVREDHQRWFKRYALAQAKKILSQIRGKFSGAVPAPGGALTLNYELLAEQGREEEAQLAQELRDMSPHVPPTFG